MQSIHAQLCLIFTNFLPPGSLKNLFRFRRVPLSRNSRSHVEGVGEFWISSSETPQAVSLTSDADVRPGQTVRTGENGMLLLVRGEESMLVSPNSVIDIPKDNRDGMSTTIMQRAGSVLVKAEKRKVNHFEVVTPYLAAVMKGTKFRVSADRSGSNVEVLEGQVDVSGFKSGEQNSCYCWSGREGGLLRYGRAGHQRFGLVQSGAGRPPAHFAGASAARPPEDRQVVRE